MIKDISLDVLIVRPNGVIGEGVDLDREAVLVWGQLADHEGQVFPGFRVIAQIGEAVGAKGADIGQPAPVDQLFEVVADVFVIFLDIRQFLIEVRAEQANPLEAGEQFVVGKLQGAQVDLQWTLDPAAPGLLHPPPVREGVRNHRVGGHRGDRLIEILHLHGGQRNVDDIAVGAAGRH